MPQQERGLQSFMQRRSCIFTSYKDTSRSFISQILVGDKKYLKWSSAMVCTIPHYKMLRITNLIKFARTQVYIDSYLPEYEHSKLPNRQWLCNVINTLVGPSLKRYVDDKIKDRVSILLTRRNLQLKRFLNLFRYLRVQVIFHCKMEGQIILLRSLGKENGMKLRIQIEINWRKQTET